MASILVPAQKRIVFEAGVQLAWDVFFGAFLHVLVPWAVEREFVQEFLRNMTEIEGGGNGTVVSGARVNEVGGNEL